MSRRAPSSRPVRVGVALTVGAASLIGATQAHAAPPAGFSLKSVSPAHVEAGVDDAFGVTLVGKGFTRDTTVKFGSCTGAAVVVPPTTVTATKLVVKPPNCGPGTVDVTVVKGSGGTPPTSVLKGKLTFHAKPQVAATDAVSPSKASWAGGASATLTLVGDLPPKAAAQVLLTTGGSTKAVSAKADPGNAKRLVFKIPPGLPGSEPSVAVSVFGIASDPVDKQLAYVSTIKTTPAVWVKGAPAPTVRVAGAGFGKGTPTVTICDEPAPLVAGVAPTDRTLLVTPPAWPAGGDDGRVCTVKVVVAGGETSVVSAGSTFTYAAY